MVSSNARRVIHLATAAAIAGLLAACNADATAPNGASRAITLHSVSHDDVPPPDSTCRSGYVLVGGRYVCNQDS
jgi:hypothetical protein